MSSPGAWIICAHVITLASAILTTVYVSSASSEVPEDVQESTFQLTWISMLGILVIAVGSTMLASMVMVAGGCCMISISCCLYGDCDCHAQWPSTVLLAGLLNVAKTAALAVALHAWAVWLYALPLTLHFWSAHFAFATNEVVLPLLVLGLVNGALWAVSVIIGIRAYRLHRQRNGDQCVKLLQLMGQRCTREALHSTYELSIDYTSDGYVSSRTYYAIPPGGRPRHEVPDLHLDGQFEKAVAQLVWAPLCSCSRDSATPAEAHLLAPTATATA